MAEPSNQLYSGLRVGSVELVAEVEPRDSVDGSKHFKQWEVLCDCGGHAYRTVANLVRAIKLDQDTCCEKCLQELRRGLYTQHIERVIRADKSKTSFFVKRFKNTGSLYGPYHQNFNYEPTQDLNTLQVDSFSLPCSTYETELGLVNPDYPQQDQWIVPLKGDAGWICYHCETPFTKGCGCVRCLTKLCDSCRDAGAHRCPKDWLRTWKNEIKDPGLLDRRIQLLKLNPLKLTTKKDIKDAKKAYRASYLQLKWEQQQEVIRELKAHAEQQKKAALERRRAELLERAKRRSEEMAKRNARWEAKARAKEKARAIAKKKAEIRAKEKAAAHARGVTRDEKARLAREARRKGMHIKSPSTSRHLLSLELWDDP
jgi:hypothetical protein